MLQMSWTYNCICKVEEETENDMENGHFITAACMHDMMHDRIHAFVHACMLRFLNANIMDTYFHIDFETQN